MNFLEICKRVRQETGVSGDGPSNVSGQVGMYAKLVDWVKSAHEDIQNKQQQWRFDWASISTPLTQGVETYLPSDVWSIDEKSWDFSSMYVYRTADGPASRTWLDRVDYNTYRQTRIPSVQGRPIYVAWTPDRKLAFYPIPFDDLVFVGDYYRKPQVMSANTDIPRIPDEYHMAIVWKAVMYWSSSEENPALYQTAQVNYNSLMSKMETTEIEGPLQAGTLA